MKMPNRDPGLWAFVITWAMEHQPALYGFVLALVTAYLRVTYSGGSQRQRVLESLLCGAISLSLMSAMEWMGVPMSASGFIGGSVGFLGVDKMRSLAEQAWSKKTGTDIGNTANGGRNE